MTRKDRLPYLIKGMSWGGDIVDMSRRTKKLWKRMRSKFVRQRIVPRAVEDQLDPGNTLCLTIDGRFQAWPYDELLESADDDPGQWDACIEAIDRRCGFRSLDRAARQRIRSASRSLNKTPRDFFSSSTTTT